MTLATDIVTAIPASGNIERLTLRNAILRRSTFNLAASEDLADFTVVDPDTGVVPLYVIQNGTIYEYDSLDTTTVASATCLVSGDATGRRYKTGGITAPWSVLSATTSAQPISPSVGDCYLVPTAATGTDWAGKDGQVAIYSRAGWQFATVPIGRGLYAENTNIRYYRNTAGTWTSGFGAVQVGANGINITNMLGVDASFVVKVENQTTETAPNSPTAFVAYIVGPSPAGAWSTYSPGDVAMCLSDGTWTRRIPSVGDQVFDKTLGYNVKWNGTAWESAQGYFIDGDSVFTAAQSGGTFSGSTDYGGFKLTAPTTTNRHRTDNVTLSYAAKRAGANLVVTYNAGVEVTTGSSVVSHSIALFRDGGSSAIAWQPINYTAGNATYPVFVEFVNVTAPDKLSHDYQVAFVHVSNADGVDSFFRREFRIKEVA